MSGDKKEFPRPSLTADIVVVIEAGGGRKVLFIKRGHDPFEGMWALPGGFVEPNETVEEAAARELEEETALTGVPVEQLRTFSKPGRDPRGWVVSVAHLAVIPAHRAADAKAGDDAADAAWLDLVIHPDGGFTLTHEGAKVEALAFDHREIVAAAVARLARGAGG